MNDIHESLVRHALSLCTARAADEIQSETRLGRDLGLDRGDIILLLLQLEELGDLLLPETELDALRTVFDLVALVRRWARSRITLLPC
jgi:acyl carrier protein